MTKISPEVASHVLGYLEEPGGITPPPFPAALIAAVDLVGGDEVLRMVTEYVEAVRDAASEPGVRRLQAIVGDELLAGALR